MTTAEVGRPEAPPKEDKPRFFSSMRPPGASPLITSGWLLRTAAFGSAIAGGMGVLIAPGVRGNGSDVAVFFSDLLSGGFAYFLLGALVALFFEATVELIRMKELAIA